MKHLLFINLYRSGVYHRQGKPNTCNMHAGDVYTSRAAAEAAIEHDKGFIATVDFMPDLPAEVYVNPPDCVPTPLSQTARVIMSGQDQGLLPLYKNNDWSLETSEAEARDIPLPWEAPAKAPGSLSKAFKPTHGGYPTYHPPGALLGRFNEARTEFEKAAEAQT